MTDELSSRLRYWHNPPWWMFMIPAPFLIGVILCSYSSISDRLIARRQQTTSGTIFVHEPANHDRYGYSFSVNQKTYSGWQIPEGNEQFTIGQVVTVHYDPLDPTNSALVDYNELSLRSLGPVPAMTVAMLFFTVFIFARRRSARSHRG